MKTPIQEKIENITSHWFLTEPLLFSIYCTHKIVSNEKLEVPFRTGKGLIEYSPWVMNLLDWSQIEEFLRIEMIRILLKHPYQRQPPFANKKVLTQASNITISEVHKITESAKDFLKGLDYDLPHGLCFEEYYNLVYEILSHRKPNTNCNTSIVPSDCKGESNDEDDNIDKQISALWEDDETMCCDINNLIEIAESSDNWGTVSGELKGLIKASMKVEMDYRRMLSLFKTSVISNKRHLTRMRPSRRFGFANMGSRYELATNLLIAVDVSGSVTDKSLSHFFSVINRFFKYGVEKLDVIQFDSELKSRSPVPMKKARHSIEISGRGGTSFQPAADFYCTHPEYDGLVFFTDGFAPEPHFNTKRPIDVLWILTSKTEYELHKDWIKKIKRNRATYIPQER